MKTTQKKSLLLCLGLFLFTLVKAQQSKDILFTIDNTPVYISEFKKVYLKNIDLVKDESQKNVDEYLNLFIDYKLKLKEAKQLGLDTKDTYLKELEGYRKQLAKAYLTDTETSDALVKEAYERSLERLNASHILIMVKPNASAEDTLKAFNKIQEAKSKIDSGAPFSEIAKIYSEDPSVKKNNGDLGWFSVFRMVYPFEEAAYNTEVGNVSTPFRTQYGYHIVKVNKREKKLGEVTAAHIMVAVNQNRTSEQAQQRINEINQQLKQGVAFASLAKQYSDDPSTAVEGGKLRKFGQGALNSEKFEQTAFGLQEENQISEPIKTRYGWHIIQLLEKHLPKSFEEAKLQIVEKVKRDSRSKLVTDSFLNSLREKYSIKENKEAIAHFNDVMTPMFKKEEWNFTKTKNDNKLIFQINNKTYSYKDFSDFIFRNQGKSKMYKDVSLFTHETYKQFESSSLLKYYEEHLEEDNEEFASVINEYRDGLLLFDLMESKIWNISKTDSLGLKKFYEDQKDKYVQNEVYKILKASSTKENVITEVQKLLKEQKSIEEIKKQINKNDAVLVLFSEEELIKGEDNLPKDFSGEKGKFMITESDNFTTLMVVKDILPSRLKTFEETKGEVINDFQKNIESQWLDHLRSKYSVRINKKTLKKAKKELSI
ncbi:peptidylprolyl isomerase [Aquimarina algicola]|uniref:Peptidylprolyl isomerase n=1 Tax=Aquimarina algicola TaxID=2589995 RepID=A0A504J390_9FLAO|nr:peptidylprolyl isomerase [Aquimarina algicola]TPN85347.1 peptidylprolyl isomerase [Aquimarina algicola]